MEPLDINSSFKELTRKVTDEPDTEKASHMLLTGIAERLTQLKVSGAYNPGLVDQFTDQMRTHAPIWAKAITVVDTNARKPAGR